MKLSTVISMSKYSELNTLAIKNDNEAIIAFINLGLLALYDIFPLRTEEYMIPLVNGVTIYDLPADYMYITGAFEPPPENSLENAKSLPINEETNPLSVNTINFSQVQIPLSITGAYVGIIYVAKPPVFTSADLDQELPIPDQLVQCLLLFVASKAHGGIRLDGQQSEGDIYYARFKRLCDDMKKLGTSIPSDDLNMDSRIRNRGFP